jgi:hypothetical protein
LWRSCRPPKATQFLRRPASSDPGRIEKWRHETERGAALLRRLSPLGLTAS